MRWSDLIETSLASLRQRFVRTLLTVLGVLIGTTSVVTMVSLGLGMSKSTMDAMTNNATMTRVTVYPGSGGGGMPGMPGGGGGGGGNKAQEKVMNAAELAKLAQIEGVERATPVYQVSAEATIGRNTGYLQITAMPRAELAEQGFEFAQGGLPQPGSGLSMIIGNKVHWNFGGTTGPDGNYQFPEIDWMKDQMFISFPDPNPSGQTPVAAPKKFIAPAAGVLGGSEATWSENDMSVFADLDEVLKALRLAYPGRALPGQPATADGKPRGNDFHYSMIYLTAVDAERAESLTTELREQGYTVSSNIELMKQMQQQFVLVQAVFGGIGFISLLVAAIGIANTMMMSVYERTKQIGIMKVLGASLRDIGRMFLVESAFIGLLGGIAGLLLSLLLSAVLNATLGAASGMMISHIPIWLMGASIVFATLIGTLAGVAPAQRAMRLSPLAAIRTE